MSGAKDYFRTESELLLTTLEEDKQYFSFRLKLVVKVELEPDRGKRFIFIDEVQ